MDYRDPDWVAEKLGLDKNTVYKYLNDGTLPAIQLGRKWLISEARLREWLERETDNQTQARRSVTRLTDRTVRRMDSFSPEAREAVRMAITEARRYGHGYLGQEHLVLGLVADPETNLARQLAAAGVTPDRVREELEQRVKAGVESRANAPLRIKRTPRAKRAMRLATGEARDRGARFVESEHLLLGILLVGEGVGHDMLKSMGIDLPKARKLIETTGSPRKKEKP